VTEFSRITFGALWRQFGAAIDMLHDAIEACPNELWQRGMWREGPDEAEYSQVWNVVYHALFWLDLYLSGSVEGFVPPSPFGLDELDPRGLLPEWHYSKEELKAYLVHCRQKCRAAMEGMTDDTAGRICTFSWGQLTYFELQLYNMRHVQEHAAQLHLFLGQEVGSAPGWVSRAREAGPSLA
jgi:hypothetical protein